MAELGSAAGLEVFAKDLQDTRTSANEIYKSIGRKPSAVPAHLSRVIYIPSHSSSDSHLPLYDVSDSFATAVGDTPIGTSMFLTKLVMMKKPGGDGADSNGVRYLVDVKDARSESEPDGTVTAQVRRRAANMDQSEAQLTLQSSGDGFALKIAAANPYRSDVAVETILHDLSAIAGAPTVQHPYFVFTLPSGSVTCEWQIRPAEHGPLRYTLVAKAAADSSDSGNPPPADRIIAIYHHIGLGNSLALPHSEGVLLLQDDMEEDPEMDLIAVSSLLGLLWRLRERSPEQQKAAAKQRSGSKSEGSPDKKSFLKKVFQKK